MIRLTRQQGGAQEVVIRVEGRLDADSIPDLRSLLEPLQAANVISVDLHGLISIDGDAREFLIGLRRLGCRLRGASLYISRLIEEA